MRLLMIDHANSNWAPHFCRFFVSRGYTFKLVSFAPGEIEGVDVEFVGVEPFDKFKNKSMFLTRLPQVRRAIRHFAPDLVYCPYLSSNGLVAALTWNGPLAVSAVGGDVKNQMGYTGLAWWLRKASIRYVCRKASLINPVSKGLTDELLRLGVPASKLFQLPFGVDTDLFYPDPAVPREQATQIICTRKHEPIYDIPVILEALATLKQAGTPFHCTITGGGMLLEKHQALVRELGLEGDVTLTGLLAYEELPARLRNADVYVSASRDDGTSVALLEAMASGLFPVVSRIEGNLPWVTDGRNGYLFDCGDHAELARLLGDALANANLRRQAFERNRQRVAEECDLRGNMSKLADRFERLLQ